MKKLYYIKVIELVFVSAGAAPENQKNSRPLSTKQGKYQCTYNQSFILTLLSFWDKYSKAYSYGSGVCAQ